MSLVVPCYEEQWKCPVSYLPCYKDCCERIHFFCNHQEKRCQRCQTRESQCGNVTQLPWECDAYCLRKQLEACNATETGCPEYKYVPFALAGAGILIMLLILALLYYCIKLRRRDQSPLSLSDKTSTTTSSSDCSSLNDKPEKTDNDYGSPATVSTALSGLHPIISEDRQPLMVEQSSVSQLPPPLPAEQCENCSDHRLKNVNPSSDDRDSVLVCTGCPYSKEVKYSVNTGQAL